MMAADHPVWFVGDLDDPWVASLADALPAAARRISPVLGTFTEDCPGNAARIVVLHPGCG